MITRGHHATPGTPVCRTDLFRESPHPRGISTDPTLARCYPGLGKRARWTRGCRLRLRGRRGVASLKGESKGRFCSTPRRLDYARPYRLTDLPTYRLAVSQLEYSYGDVHDVDDPGLWR